MKTYGKKIVQKKDLKKDTIVLENKSFFNFIFIQRIFDTINFSLLVLILIFSFVSLKSQREWTNAYGMITRIREKNNNLIDLISKTEEFYIDELESFDTFRKATPEDLIYLEKKEKNNLNIFSQKMIKIIEGFKDSKYNIGY